MKLLQKLSLLGLLPFVLLAAPAHAQLNLVLTPASQAGNPGDTLTFSGTLSNPTADLVSVDGLTGSINGPTSQLDNTSFLTNGPLSLDPMGTTDSFGNPTDSYFGSLFDVTINPDALPGTYTGTVLIPTAGYTGSQPTHSDFSITVLPAAAVPEAATAISLGFLLLLGGVSLCCVKRRAAGRE